MLPLSRLCSLSRQNRQSEREREKEGAWTGGGEEREQGKSDKRGEIVSACIPSRSGSGDAAAAVTVAIPTQQQLLLLQQRCRRRRSRRSSPEAAASAGHRQQMRRARSAGEIGLNNKQAGI